MVASGYDLNNFVPCNRKKNLDCYDNSCQDFLFIQHTGNWLGRERLIEYSQTPPTQNISQDKSLLSSIRITVQYCARDLYKKQMFSWSCNKKENSPSLCIHYPWKHHATTFVALVRENAKTGISLIISQIKSFCSPTLCCVFLPANGCFVPSLLVMIFFISILTSFLHQNKEKRR